MTNEIPSDENTAQDQLNTAEKILGRIASHSAEAFGAWELERLGAVLDFIFQEAGEAHDPHQIILDIKEAAQVAFTAYREYMNEALQPEEVDQAALLHARKEWGEWENQAEFLKQAWEMAAGSVVDWMERKYTLERVLGLALVRLQYKMLQDGETHSLTVALGKLKEVIFWMRLHLESHERGQGDG